MINDLQPLARVLAMHIRKRRQWEVPATLELTPASDASADLARWQTKALKSLKNGRSPNVAFTSTAIGAELHAGIRERLASARSAADVRAIFKASQQQQQKDKQNFPPAMAALLAAIATAIAGLVTLYVVGRIDLARFTEEMESRIKEAYQKAYEIGATVQQGAQATLTNADLSIVTNYVHDEIEYLKGFKRALQLDQVPDSEAYLRNRADLYADAVIGLYWEGRRSRVQDDYDVWYECEDDENSCMPCRLNEARSPYAVEDVPIPGNDCDGGSRCRCTLRFVHRQQSIAAAAAPDLAKQMAEAKHLPHALRALAKVPTVLLVRHGDTDLNEQNRIRAWQNPPLNDAGRQEAEELARYMAAVNKLDGHDVRRLVASDLKRTMQTADVIGDELGVEVEAMPALRSWNVGDFAGKKVEDVLDEMNRLQTEDRDTPAPGGESFNEFLGRFLGGLKGLMDDALQYPDDFTVAVCHTRNQRAAIGWLESGMKGIQVDNKPLLSEKEIGPGGFLALAHDGDRWEIVEQFRTRRDQDEE